MIRNLKKYEKNLALFIYIYIYNSKALLYAKIQNISEYFHLPCERFNYF